MNKPIAVDPATELPDVQPRRRRRNTRQAILDAAQHQFIAEGYNGTRVSEVARMADVSIGSIYVHFESKEGLYAALMERGLAIEARYFDAIYNNPKIPDIEKIFTIGEAYLQFYREHPAFFRMLMLPHEDVPEETTRTPIGLQVTARRKLEQQRLADAIRSCIAEGLIRDDVDPELAADFFWAAWNGAIVLNLRRDELALDDEALDQVILQGRLILAQGTAGAVLRDKTGGLLPRSLDRVKELKHEVVSPY